MRAVRVGDAATCLERAGSFLALHEPEHCLPLGLLGRLRSAGAATGSLEPTFVVALDDERVVGCLVHTPPHGAVLSRFESAAAVDEVAVLLHGLERRLSGAIGPKDVVERFARGWAATAGVGAELAIRERIHAATGVRHIPRAPGRMRRCRPDDIPVVVPWIAAFLDEALRDSAPAEDDPEMLYRRRDADPGGAWLVWDDGGRPVSLAGYGNETAHGVRVGPVYTPPALRGAGYATSLVAELTAGRLAHGRSFCTLFTDLANPTSNAVYARVGYEPVADWDMWAFHELQA